MRIGRFDFSPTLWPTLATLAVLPLLIWLGFWQLGRAVEKQALLDRFAERAGAVPVSLDGADAARADPQWWLFRRVRATGRFDSAHQYLVDNRTHAGAAGYHVLTLLAFPGESRGVIVNRGWVPVGARRDRLPAVAVGAQPVEIEGQAMTPSTGGLLLGADGYDAAGWPKVVQRIDMDRIAAQLGTGLPPFLVRLDPGSATGFVREWPPLAGFGPDRHRGYAVQWFALALTLVAIYSIVNTRRVA